MLTDAYFHYTPSQIMMASLLLANQELTKWYIASKFSSNDQASTDMKAKVMETVERCAAILKTIAPDSGQAEVDKKELKVLFKKLKRCRNPEKADLVGLQRAKRQGEDGNDEKVVKKRKLEREKSAKEGEDLFGPEIKREQ
jgi:cyclin H